MDRVIINNIPSSNRADFGYRSINTSDSHNENQNKMLDDILNLYNKTNEIERVVKENADFIKLENTHLESVNHSLTNEYKALLDGYNGILNGETIRKKVILPKDCKVEDQLFGAIVSDITSDITVRPSRKISKLAVFDSITDGMYIPDTLEVDIRNRTLGVITETDNDIYAPFYNDNEMYWTRKVVTDNTAEEVKTEYIINLAEEIMTTAEMNEIVIHPFLCNVVSVYLRHGDSNPWEKIYGIDHHPALNYGEEEVYDFSNAPRPFRLSFPNTKANQMKIVLKAKDYIEGETNLRNFMFGIKHIGAYINYYNPYDASHFNTVVDFNEKDSVIVEGFTFNFNNDIPECRYVSDIDYEFYYKDEYGSLQKIFEEFPFVVPSKQLFVKFRIGEKYKDINIRSIDLNYRALIEDYAIMVSYMPNLTIDFKNKFNLYYTVKSSGSNTFAEVVGHELSLDDGVTWIQMGTIFDGQRYVYEHPALKEVCVKSKCIIRVTDFDGRVGISNKFKINAEQFDKPPLIDFINDITVFVNDPLQIVYIAGDDYAVTKHEFSDSSGNVWKTVEPYVEEEVVRGIQYKRYTIDLTYDKVGARECYIRLSDGVNDPVLSNLFLIDVKPIEVTGLILDKYTLVMPRGTKAKLNHTVLPLDATDKSVMWETSNPAVAKVDDYGLVTAVDKRNCNVVVRTLDGKHRATCEVTVLIPVEKVLLNASSIVLYVGETFKLNETVFPIDADNKRVTWSISNSSATINDGLVTAVNAGTCIATVTTEDGAYKAHCSVEVRVPVSGISITKKKIIKKVGEKEQLVASVIPNNAFNQKILWDTTDSFVASVSSTGLVSANSPGKVIITATTDQYGFEETCEVEVLIPVSGVTLNKHSLVLPSDGVEQLIATVLPVDAFDKSVTWTSSDSTVATVDENGLVSPGRNEGTSTITVKTNDRGYTDSCNVTVYDRIFAIVLSKINVLVPVTYSRQARVSFTNWSDHVELEEILVESLNPDIFEVSKYDPNVPFDTSSFSWLLNIKGLKVGTGKVKISTTDGRAEAYINVAVGEAIEKIEFVNPDSTTVEEGVLVSAMYTVPVGFIRTVNYNILPEDSPFHLGNLDTGKLYNNSYHTVFDVSRKGEVDISIPFETESFQTNPYYRDLELVESNADMPRLVQEVYAYKIKGSMDWGELPEVLEVKRGDTFTLPFKFEPDVDASILEQFRLRTNLSSRITSSVLDDKYYDGSGAYGYPSVYSNSELAIEVVNTSISKFKVDCSLCVGPTTALGEYSLVIVVPTNSYDMKFNYRMAYKFKVIE